MKVKLLYEKIVEQLSEDIKSGQLQVNSKLPTEEELAEQFGVSRITSKRALEELRLKGLIYRRRGSGSYVAEKKEDTKPIIYKASSEIQPTNIKNIISIILPFDISRGGLMATINGASQVLNESGYFLSIHSSAGDIAVEKELLDNLFEQKIGGVILYPLSDRENFQTMNKFFLANFPLVTIDKYYESIPISCVVSDNKKGSYDATQHLIKQGHKRIAFLSDVGIEEATSVRNRYFGYCQALIENEISIEEDLIATGIFGTELKKESDEDRFDTYELVLKQMLAYKVTAAICVNDYVASAVMKVALHRLKLKVPDMLSIIGYDNIEIAEHLQVPLTSVAQDFDNMGRVAAKLLLDSIKDSHQYSKVVLPAHLVVRESSTKEYSKK